MYVFQNTYAIPTCITARATRTCREACRDVQTYTYILYIYGVLPPTASSWDTYTTHFYINILSSTYFNLSLMFSPVRLLSSLEKSIKWIQECEIVKIINTSTTELLLMPQQAKKMPTCLHYANYEAGWQVFIIVIRLSDKLIGMIMSSVISFFIYLI